jgi:hypothetical protein
VLDSPLGTIQVLVVHLRPPVSDGGSFVWGHFTTPAIHEKEITRFCGSLDRARPTLRPAAPITSRSWACSFSLAHSPA